jgi:hypothetical protein
MTSPDVKAPEAHPTLATHQLLGVAGLHVSSWLLSCLPTRYRQVIAVPVEAK